MPGGSLAFGVVMVLPFASVTETSPFLLTTIVLPSKVVEPISEDFSGTNFLNPPLPSGSEMPGGSLTFGVVMVLPFASVTETSPFLLTTIVLPPTVVEPISEDFAGTSSGKCMKGSAGVG